MILYDSAGGDGAVGDIGGGFRGFMFKFWGLFVGGGGEGGRRGLDRDGCFLAFCGYAQICGVKAEGVV